MRRSIVALALAVLLAVLSPGVACARDLTSGSLLGPLIAQRIDNGMSILGTVHELPAGSKIWVEIIHKPSGPGKPFSGPEDDHVIVNADGTFEAHLLDPSGSGFKSGLYGILITSHFNSAWQTADVLRSAGVELDSQDRSSISTDPKAIPESSDFKPDDPEFPHAGRYLSVVREVSLARPAADVAAIERVKGATLFVQGKGRSSLPVGKSVDWFASLGPSEGFRPIGWSAVPATDGKWTITLDCIDGEKQKKAQWSYDPKSRGVMYLDPVAKTLSYVPPD